METECEKTSKKLQFSFVKKSLGQKINSKLKPLLGEFVAI